MEIWRDFQTKTVNRSAADWLLRDGELRGHDAAVRADQEHPRLLSGSSTTLATMWASVADRQAAEPAPGSVAAPAAAPSEDGVQRIVVTVSDTGYDPAVVRVKAGVPTQVTFRTDGTQGCTRSLVVPSLRIGRRLSATGDTTLDLGQLATGRLRYTCGMGMYSGTVEAT